MARYRPITGKKSATSALRARLDTRFCSMKRPKVLLPLPGGGGTSVNFGWVCLRVLIPDPL